MKIIGKYVLKEHIGPFLFASTALTSVMLLQYIAKRFGELVGKGLPASVIVEFMALSIPFTIAMTLPMAVLVAVLYAFSRLAAENEITALKASGVGMWSLLRPVLLGGAAMSLLMVGFNDQVLPAANHRLAVLQLDIFRTKPTFALREQVLNAVKEGQLYLRAGDIDERTALMKDVVIYDFTDQTHRRTITAESGTLALAPNRRDLEMTLFRGNIVEIPANKPQQMTRLFFRRDRMRVRGVASSYQESQGQVSKGDREMSVCEMNRMLSRADYQMRMAAHDVKLIEAEITGVTPPKAPDFRFPPGLATAYCSMLSFVGSKANAQSPSGSSSQAQDDAKARMAAALAEPRSQDAKFRYEDARRDRNRYDVEIQKKFSLAAACLIFVLIGAPLALRFPRGGIGFVIGVSFVIFGIYYVGLIQGETWADKGYMPPWVAMWAANILLTVVGIVLALQMGRETTTSRGGDLGELLDLLRTKTAALRRPFAMLRRRRA